MLRQIAARVTGWRTAGPGVVDVEHVTSFVAIALMAATEGIMSIILVEILGPNRDCFVAIRRKEILIRIILTQKHRNYSTRSMLMEVETLP